MKTHKQTYVKINRAVLSLFCLLVLGTLLVQPLIGARAQESAQARQEATGTFSGDTAEYVKSDAQGQLFADDAMRRLEFTTDGLRYLPKPESYAKANNVFEYHLKAVSRSEATDEYQAEKARATPFGKDAEVAYYRSSAVTETYRAVEGGVEQTFALDNRFAGGKGDLVIAGKLGGNLESQGADIRSLNGLTFYAEGQPMLSVAPAVVTDRAGEELVPEMRLESGELQIVIDEAWLRNKTFPLTVKSTIRTLPGSTAEAITESLVATAVVSEDLPVWQAQLRVQTADVTDAGTDDDVSVQLVEPGWLDYGRNDFERNDAFTYDLVLDNVHTLRDISMLRISKTGTNGWCLRSIYLYINGRAIYAQDFGSLGRWFDVDPLNDHRTYTVNSTALRAHSLWTSYVQPSVPLSFSRQELKSRVENLVGDYMIKNTSTESCGYLRWGGLTGSDYVEVGRANVQSVHFDLDLKMFVHHGLDYNYDVDFDLEFSCSDGKINIVTRNVRSADGICLAEGDLSIYLIHRLPAQIAAALRNFTYMNMGQPACPTITVLDDGSLSLAFPRVR